MSKLRDLLAAKAGGNPVMSTQTQTSEPAPASAPASTAKPSFNSLLKKAKAKEAERVASGFNMSLENGYVPPPTAPLEDFQNLHITLTSDVTEWPDTQDGFSQAAVDQLKLHLAKVRETLVSADVSDALDRCLKFIHDNPNLKELLLPEDVGTLVQALASSASVVISKKNENKATAKKRKDIALDVLNDVASIGF